MDHHAKAELKLFPASYPRIHASTGAVIPGGVGKEPPVLHVPSHSRDTSRPDPDPAVLGLMVLWKCLGNNPRVCLGRWRANLHVRHTAQTGLSPAAFDARLNSRTSPGPSQGFNHLGIITSSSCRPGVWEILRLLVFQPAHPSQRCWELAFPLHPSTLWIPARILPMVSQTTAPWR